MKNILDRYLEDARNGVPDKVIAEKSGCSITAVGAWRRSLGIKKPGGVLGGIDNTKQALKLLGPTYDPTKHVVNNTFGGKWKVPRYVLRVALNYTGFCIAVAKLAETMSDAEIAEAIGIAEYDIGNARAAYARYLAIHGAACEVCGIKEPRHRCRGKI